MKIWNRAEQTLVGLLGLATLAFALWQAVSRYFFPHQSSIRADSTQSHPALACQDVDARDICAKTCFAL